MSLASMSLFLLKTRDLTVQDHSMNIEVMLAPNRTYLLMNKHKTLNAKNRKQEEEVEKQRDSSNHSYVSEKRLVDRRNQDFYIKRVNMFLNQLTPDKRTDVLTRKSFSPSLNKIQNENKQPVINETTITPRKPKPKAIQKSEPNTPRGSICQGFPVIPTSRKESQSSIGFSERARDRDFMDKRPKTYREPTNLYEETSFKVPTSRTYTTSNEQKQNMTSPVPEYFPPVSPTHNITRDVISPTFSTQAPEPQTVKKEKIMPSLGPQKKVKFDTTKHLIGYKLWHQSQLKEKNKIKHLDNKIKDFLFDQLKFNQKTAIAHYDLCKSSAYKDENRPSNKEELIDIFDKFCKTGNKQQMHKLVKIAARLRAKPSNPTVSTSIVPSIETFKRSHAFRRLNESQRTGPTEVLVNN